jgi:hypothetical protein
VNDNFLADFPPPGELEKSMKSHLPSVYREVNCHIHTPYSFSAFNDLESLFMMAKKEKIDLLGINDFYVTDGYEEFYRGCTANGIFPLFNIEFIGLMKEEQKKGIRINDPNNPGRIYFCGKGLDYPFHLNPEKESELDNVRNNSQKQVESMVAKLNVLISAVNPRLILDFGRIKKRYARDLVRERHLARAVRVLATEHYNSEKERLAFIDSLYGAKKSKTGFSDPAAIENEIRSNLLKAGGAAFVEEDELSFLELKKIMDIITDAGGIPCYPVLLDDPSGNFTEFEASPEKLYESLRKLGVSCIELIPARNDYSILKDFVRFFDEKGFIITFGTEHNTPELIPLTVTARKNMVLEDSIKNIAFRGASVIAAHQYLRSQKRKGFVTKYGTAAGEKEDFESLGRMVIEYYLNNRKNESGNF